MADKKEGLCDQDIREPLFLYLEEHYGKVRILEEKRTGSARADVVMITPSLLYGIEIKSDADTYVRLSRQVKNYDWYYDRNILVVGSTHAKHAAEHVPSWWGLLSAEQKEGGGVDFYELREPLENPKVKPARKIQILWRREINHLLALHSLPRYPGKSKAFVQEALLSRVEPEKLWPSVCEELCERDYTTIEEE
ncbi:MAG: sce7726 family protein, partial [Blautia sp.]|nr:sce7726 family protein [Blautia sp.]